MSVSRFMLVACMVLALMAGVVSAQDVEQDLIPLNIELTTRIDAFGLEEQILSGVIANTGEMAYGNVTIYADLLDADDNLIGEGFGFIVNACGKALLDDPIQPIERQHFELTLDFYEADSMLADWQLIIEAEAVAPEARVNDNLPDAITMVADGEVVALEWVNEATLRYGVGCHERVFTTYDWYQYDLARERVQPLAEHPNAQFITDAMLQQTGINQITQSREDDPRLFERSMLTFPTVSERIVWQSDIHTIITSERDGSFKRTVHTFLHPYSLRGFVWSPLGNFLAYYYGAHGERVRYFTATSSGQLISDVITGNTPSVIVPGLTDDARRAIIGGTFENADGERVTGYYFVSTITGSRELLFEADLPGNNYPAPAYWRKNNNTRYIYIVRPVDGQPTLQCFHREGGELYTLTPLPLQLENDERAWSALSPQSNTLAIAANGRHGGVWLVDLNAFDVCR